ncbi:MAG: nuclear transport factor 2 family protein [Alphaproteobacteria bacterium]|nr:nuclear transport factor 2 family protein [Alphaproteobacteria bacterium]
MPAPTPRQIAALQLDRYNARDLDGFCSLFQEDAELWELPAMTLRARGMAAIRAIYADRFSNPDLFCRVHATIDLGEVAIDRETVTGVPGAPLEVIAQYHVVEGKIAKVFFWRG